MQEQPKLSASRYETTITLTVSIHATTEEKAIEKAVAAMDRLADMRLGRGVRVQYVDGGIDYDVMEGQ